MLRVRQVESALVPAIQIVRPGLVERLQRFASRIMQVLRRRSSIRQRILVVTRERDDAIRRLCRRLALQLDYASSLPLALTRSRMSRFDVVLYDHDLTAIDWRTAIAALTRAFPQSSVLLLSRTRSPELWNEVVRSGGHDMLNKPICEDGAESTIALAMAVAAFRKRRPCVRHTE